MTDPKHWPIVSEANPVLTDLHFNIRKPPRGQATEQLILSLSSKLVASLGFEKGCRYALSYDYESGCFAVMAHARGAVLRVPHQSSRYHLYFILRGELADLWAFEPCSNEPLKIKAWEKGWLVFEYPEYETAEAENEPAAESEEDAPANPWAKSRL